LRAILEADRLIAAEPEKYSELIAKVSGIEAPVIYLFHGPLGLQTRDLTWKQQYRQAVATSIETLKLLKRADTDLPLETFVTDSYVREAFKASGLDYEARLADFKPLPLVANDEATGKPIASFERVAEIWLADEPRVRHYATAEGALHALVGFEKAGKTARAVYAQDRATGNKLLAPQAWFVRNDAGEISAFLLKGDAEAWAKAKGGGVLNFAAAKASAS